MGIFKQKADYFNIGLSGTEEQLFAAGREIQNGKDQPAAQKELLRGASQAFMQGNHRNIQAIVANGSSFKIKPEAGGVNDGLDVTSLIAQLAKESKDPASVIDLAYKRLTEEAKAANCTHILNDAICRNIGTEAFYEALLKCGATANVENRQGFKGVVMANAISRGQPLSVVKLLHEHGASFDDARILMSYNSNIFNKTHMDRLSACQEGVTGAKPQSAADKKLEEMQEQIRDLTEIVINLADEIETLKAEKKKAANENKPPQQKPFSDAKKKNYPAVKGL